ncbi:MAG: hypothetical protein B7Z73_05915 [Planctomycetia bacterium 21-64-5]|nr:MAG: hypothetical protein B7Z73_05915 [Planctomycetia bacterium 21-64-5]
MTSDPGVTHLSRYVCGKLEEVAKRYDDFDEWAMVEETHRLPEWIRNEPGNSSREIPLLHILEAVGRSKDLQQIISGARQDALAADFFSETPSAALTSPAVAP